MSISSKVRYTLNEVKKAALISQTDNGRKFRSKYQVRVNPPRAIGFDDGNEFVEGNTKAYPSTENKRHYCYLIHNPKTREIKQLWCSCKDFNYRLMVPYERAGLAKRADVPMNYQKQAAFQPNRNWTVKTNPTGKKFLCKHLLALSNYIN